MTKHYAVLYSRGIFFDESGVIEIGHRQAYFHIPRNVFGYQIFSKTVTEIEGEILEGKENDFSPMTYFGEILTLEDVKKLEPRKDYETLICNMECNAWDRVVRTRCGNFKPLENDDVVILDPYKGDVE